MRSHAGANEYIMKPFDKDIVPAKFREVGLFEFTVKSPVLILSACPERLP